jgi:SAM-dependent methyltransferase
MQEQDVFKMLYKRLGASGKLPWAHEEATEFLDKITEQGKLGEALDIGCGSGVDSVYLAGKGWQVTSVDFIPDALQMVAALAEKEGVNVTTVATDVTTWESGKTYDLIVDAGVLHNMKPHRHASYRQRLMQWLKPDGDLVLVHFEKRHWLDWRPIGPRRWSRASVNKFFASDLREIDFHQHIATGLPIFIGPTLAMSTYWFKRESLGSEKKGT